MQLRIWNFLIARTAKGEPIEREIGRESPSLPPQRSCGFSCSPFHLEARVTENDPRTLLAIFSFLPPTPPLSFFLPSLSLSPFFRPITLAKYPFPSTRSRRAPFCWKLERSVWVVESSSLGNLNRQTRGSRNTLLC